MTHARLLSCPACEIPMKVIDRGGIHIDRCGGCKGVFLDNGELEKLIALMTAGDDDDDWLQPPAKPAAQPAPVYQSPPPVYESHHHHHHGHGHGGKQHYYKHRKKSAMKTFMDIFD